MFRGLTLLHWKHASRGKLIFFLSIIRGFFWSSWFMVILFAGAILWALYTPGESHYLFSFFHQMSFVSAFVGGMVGSRASGIGWLQGGLIGACWGSAVVFFNLYGELGLFSNTDLARMFVSYTICGGMGGIMGINLKRLYMKLSFLKKKRTCYLSNPAPPCDDE